MHPLVLDKLLLSINDKDVPVFVHGSNITCPQPTVRSQRLSGRVYVLIVSTGEALSQNIDETDGPTTYFMTAGERSHISPGSPGKASTSASSTIRPSEFGINTPTEPFFWFCLKVGTYVIKPAREGGQLLSKHAPWARVMQTVHVLVSVRPYPVANWR